MTDVSILEVIKRGGYEASLITTFNATLSFYEEVVLRRLISAGSRLNLVLMDAKQCARAWESEAAMPKLAGRAYGLIPIESAGVFHPKICLLIGPKKANLLVGSHNLTLSGFGFNQEVTSWIEVKGEKDAEGGYALASTWRMVQEWVAPQRASLPPVVVEALDALGRHIEQLTRTTKEPEHLAIHGQLHHGPSLWEQVMPSLPDNVKSVVVVGAFFDADMAFVRALRKRCPSARIRVVVQPDTVHLGKHWHDLDIQFVDQLSLWPDLGKAYLHAKVLYCHSDQGDVLVSGSANPSAPAWLGGVANRNQEAVVLLKGQAARQSAKDLGLLEALHCQPLDDQKLIDACQRPGDERVSERRCASVRLMEVAHGVDRLTIDFEGADSVIAVTADLEGSTEPKAALWLVRSPNLIDVSLDEGFSCVRSLLLSKLDGEAVRVMLVDQAQILALSQGRQQASLRDALLQLGEGSGDLSSLIASVERVIFAEDVSHELRRPRVAASTSTDDRNTGADDRPSSLAIHVADMRHSGRKPRMLQGGDLAFLISALISRIGVTADKAEGTDRYGRSEEEAIGQDDEVTSDVDDGVGTVQLAATDEGIADKVRRKVRTLVRRVGEQLEAAQPGSDEARMSMVQLVAVLSVIRELRRLRHTQRWRHKTELAAEVDRDELLCAALNHLCGHGRNLLDAELAREGAASEEVSHLLALLAWLAWDIGYGLTADVDPMGDPDEQWAAVYGNAVVFELFLRIVGDEPCLAQLQRSVALTAAPTIEAAAEGQAWIARNHASAEQLDNRPIEHFKSAAHLRVGRLAAVPSVKGERRLRVISAMTTEIVSLWDFGEERSFQRSRFTT